MIFAMFLFLAPSGTQSEGTRDPIQNLPPTAPTPLSLPAHWSWTPPPQTHTFQYYMISFVGIFHPYQAYIRTRQIRFTGVHQIPTSSKRSDFHEKYLAAQPQLEGSSQVLEGWLTSPNESNSRHFQVWKKLLSKTGFTTYRGGPERESRVIVQKFRIQAGAGTGRVALGGGTVR